LLLRDRIPFRQRSQEDELVGRHAPSREMGVGLAVERQVGGPKGHGDVMPGCHAKPMAFVTYTDETRTSSYTAISPEATRKPILRRQRARTDRPTNGRMRPSKTCG